MDKVVRRSLRVSFSVFAVFFFVGGFFSLVLTLLLFARLYDVNLPYIPALLFSVLMVMLGVAGYVYITKNSYSFLILGLLVLNVIMVMYALVNKTHGGMWEMLSYRRKLAFQNSMGCCLGSECDIAKKCPNVMDTVVKEAKKKISRLLGAVFGMVSVAMAIMMGLQMEKKKENDEDDEEGV